MTRATLALAITATAAVSGCVCHCETKFEAACVDSGGRVQSAPPIGVCVAPDGGVMATWTVHEDDDGG